MAKEPQMQGPNIDLKNTTAVKSSTNRDLLKEAIEESKAVKETAIANAKAALEEAFAPRLTSIIQKLTELK